MARATVQRLVQGSAQRMELDSVLAKARPLVREKEHQSAPDSVLATVRAKETAMAPCSDLEMVQDLVRGSVQQTETGSVP